MLAQCGETWQQSNVPGTRERRRPGHFRICVKCGKRNKARRAECSRCHEPLRGLPEAAPRLAQKTASPPRRYRWLVAAAVLIAVAAGFLVHRLFNTSPAGSAAQAIPSETPGDLPSPAPAAPPTFDPTSAERWAEAKGSIERGQRLLAQGDFRRAASLLAEGVRLVPEDPRTANAYGRALLGLGSRDRALPQFERAARLDTGVAAYRIDYARALAAAGRNREAAREYEAAASLEPGNVAASEGLLRLQPSEPAAAEGTSVDLGGAAPGDRPAPAGGGAFTNEDLARGARPMRPPSPSPLAVVSPSPRPLPVSSASPRPLASSPPRTLSASPSPYSGPFASPRPD
jgi:hypothetical protein